MRYKPLERNLIVIMMVLALLSEHAQSDWSLLALVGAALAEAASFGLRKR